MTLTLETTPEENLRMVADSVRVPRPARGGGCFSTRSTSSTGSCEDPTYALQVLRAAEEAGASRLVLCDTNGGTLTGDAMEVVGNVAGQVRTPLGVHFHNDAASAVASSVVGGRRRTRSRSREPSTATASAAGTPTWSRSRRTWR